MSRLVWPFLLCVLALPALAASPSVDPKLSAVGWKIFTFTDLKPAHFRLAEDGSIEVEAAGSVAGLYRFVVPGDERKPILTWRWRVDRADIQIVDLSHKANADRPVALHVGFAQDDSTGGFFRNLSASLMGMPPPGRVLSYTWGGRHQRGDSFVSPHFGELGHVVILRPGDTPLQQWQEERVDVHADFRRFFGYEPPEIAYIVLSGDADDQPGHTQARVADITLSDR
ncbi:MAG: DUF3047 domain-containing protein [Alphaproteobacteria bacterium]|nr:DUF3047 domain-containing protein [Alphaproteobacteria bacterium]MBU0796752.1 DUF3047 domain-containing protein [Alphaproteobacteria bacterium]MBU0888284.1 DUF3047 domain-containing protein [Alphaproteobacteria bacterium]MBU1811485.1 DUF3047 domain-containing protein [Alphaproteobacteria bacterium]